MVRWLVLAGLCQVLLASGVFGALPMDDKDWYQAAIIYQLYPRSFQDTDGDGIGDLKGVLQRIDYLAELGIDAVWFSPIHPSPNEDFGYDISDFTDINPEYGTLQDFDELVAALKKRGIRTILDFVPNHSSTEHEWFKRSENNETDYADLYVWKNAKGVDRYGNRIPPNNWLGVINTGSAWEWSEKRQQYYLHNFLVHQADLNYRSPVLRQKMLDVLSFWLRRGVDGFRVDAVSWFVEDAQLRDEPRAPWYDPKKPNNYNNLLHIYTMDQEENFPIIEDWRELFDSFSGVLGSTRVMITESYSDYKTLMKYYGVDRPGATFPFNFLYVLPLARVANATAWEEAVNEYYRIIGDHAPNWVLGNHDQSRVVNKWGGEEWVDILNMVLLTLRGTAITYYGEEIGLENSTVRWDQAVDMQGKVAGEQDFYLRSRDFERNPMPWSGEHLGGFTTGPKSWVPLAPSYWRLNVEKQKSAERSHLKLYQRLAQLRKTLTLSKGSCVVKSQSGTFFYVIRSYPENPTYITVVNLGSDPAKPRLSELRNNLPSLFTLQASSTNFPDYMKSVLHENEIVMPPKSAIVIST